MIYLTSLSMKKNEPIKAFGVEPSPTKYRLRLARYKGLSEAVTDFVKSKDLKDDSKIDMLDIGIGSGRSLRYIDHEGRDINISDKINLFGLDLMVDRLAGVYGSERWKLTRGNIEKGIPFQDNSFDLILCEQLLEHLNDPKAAVIELNRVIKPGGLLILGVPIFFPPLPTARNIIMPLVNKFRDKPSTHLQTFSLFSIKSLVKNNSDFELIDSRGYRIVSGGPLKPLDNFYWWYKLNRILGRIFTPFCIEVQLILRLKP